MRNKRGKLSLGKTSLNKEKLNMKKVNQNLFLSEDKKGFEMAISTLILMIIGVVLLISLITFFTMGSAEFIKTIKSYVSYSNVDNAVESCNILVDTNQQNTYCCEKRIVKYYEEGDKKEESFSCYDLIPLKLSDNLKEMSCNVEC
ncbi:MAG: hypothetical protein WC438_02105 [Candidatus Pacearchaeota archaeon]